MSSVWQGDKRRDSPQVLPNKKPQDISVKIIQNDDWHFSLLRKFS